MDHTDKEPIAKYVSLVRKVRKKTETAVTQSMQGLVESLASGDPGAGHKESELLARIWTHGSQQGDILKDDKLQVLAGVRGEAAYEYWHRMLFTRFLMAKGLMKLPSGDGRLREASLNRQMPQGQGGQTIGWEMAVRLAARMLPQIIRSESPFLRLTISPLFKDQIFSAMEQFPQELFKDIGILGLFYQSWSVGERAGSVLPKDAAGKARTSAEWFRAATQVSTSPIAAGFLLDNTLGAWWAARRLGDDDRKTAKSEALLRGYLSADGTELPTLRFTQEEGVWTPAAGTFESWPDELSELKVMDPCCGAGTFLVALFRMLVPMRMKLEGLKAPEAVDAVLRENVHGLDVDRRCVDLAKFALTFAAWTFPGGGGCRELPELNVACSGLPVNSLEEEWRGLAEENAGLETALKEMHAQFKDASLLGSLIDPEAAFERAGVSGCGWKDVFPLLDKALAIGTSGYSGERSVWAKETAKAGSLLSRRYALVVANLPVYCLEGKSDELKDCFFRRYPDAEGELAPSFVERIANFRSECGTAAIVLPNVFFAPVPYAKFMLNMLNRNKWHIVAKLGDAEENYYTDSGLNAAMAIFSRGKLPDGASEVSGVDVSGASCAVQDPERVNVLNVKDCLVGNKKGNIITGKINNLSYAELLDAFVGKAPLLKFNQLEETIFGYHKSFKKKQEELSSDPEFFKLSERSEPSEPSERSELSELSEFSELFELSEGSQHAVLHAESARFEHAVAYTGIDTGDDKRFTRYFWERPSVDSGWRLYHELSTYSIFSKPLYSALYSGRMKIINWKNAGLDMLNPGRSNKNLGAKGVVLSNIYEFKATLYTGELYSDKSLSICPIDKCNLPALWCYLSSLEYKHVREDALSIIEEAKGRDKFIPFDPDRWTVEAGLKFPNGLPGPYSDDPTQWLFHGHPFGSVVWDDQLKRTVPGPRRLDKSVLHVAVARLLGYRWPAELDETMELCGEQRELVSRCEALSAPGLVAENGIVCIPAVAGEAEAADRLKAILAASYGDGFSDEVVSSLLKSVGFENGGLQAWLRDGFFKEHCVAFENRPFIWQIGDGRPDGFSALINYHKLSCQLLSTLNDVYIAGWVKLQEIGISNKEPGAKARQESAKGLMKRINFIMHGDAPLDVFVRWKTFDEQPTSFCPDVDDGVRVNIRPFAIPYVWVGIKKSSGILRDKVNLDWNSDEGDFPPTSEPWNTLFKGERVNRHHLTIKEKAENNKEKNKTEDENSANSENSKTSASPASPKKPASPANPKKTASPADPKKTASPASPKKPASPADPKKPASPADPRKTASPADPRKTASPADPRKPASPADPRKPASPADPKKPASPADPKKPASPADPKKPASPADPKNSASPADSNNSKNSKNLKYFKNFKNFKKFKKNKKNKQNVENVKSEQNVKSVKSVET
ncbi:MAG: hypothetical protein LBQ12_12950 [Deltaproteobacteria bacterium]|jgi:hypothetical protein|nr:hypothetical protein [Deltaproteobacteria bacterium]